MMPGVQAAILNYVVKDRRLHSRKTEGACVLAGVASTQVQDCLTGFILPEKEKNFYFKMLSFWVFIPCC